MIFKCVIVTEYDFESRIEGPVPPSIVLFLLLKIYIFTQIKFLRFYAIHNLLFAKISSSHIIS